MSQSFSLSRRRFGQGLAVASASLALPAGAAEGGLEAIVVEEGGRHLVFAESAGEDLGDYVGPGFVQRCIRVMREESPLTVFFRPDRGSDRVEVVFELGRLWGEKNRAAASMGKYTAVIRRGERVLAEIQVPQHLWFAAWRWQSAPRPVVRTAPQLMEAHLVPRFSRAAARNAVPLPKRPVYAGPMDNAGVNRSMPDPGDRPDIGLFTEYQGEYLVAESAGGLEALLAQAEAAGSVPWHMRDETTGAPVDFYRHPLAHWYQRPYEVAGEEFIRRNPAPWNVDDAHQPALAYVAFVLTGDPYFLEQLQFQHGYNVGWTLWDRTLRKFRPVFAMSETRGYAWSLRTGAELARVAPETPPRWLLGRGYYKRVLDENLAYFRARYVDNPDPAYQRFHISSPAEQIASWQEAFLTCSVGLCVLFGFDEWRPVLEWKLELFKALTNGTSGWNRLWCAPYYFSVVGPDKRPHENWAAVWQHFKAAQNPPIDEASFPPNGAWAQGARGQSWQFLAQVRAPLALGAQLGVAGAAAGAAWFDRLIDSELARVRATMDFKWSLA